MKKLITLLMTCALCVSLCAQEIDAIASAQESTELQTTEATELESPSLITRITNWYTDHTTYWAITGLMAVESSFIPFPSEIVVPPAVYVASKEGSPVNVSDRYIINVLLIILFATIGAMLGAIINYWLSAWLGRPIIYKFANSKLGHLLLLSGDKVKEAEEYFNKRGKLSTFVGRLIPAVRQLISIPAGLARMHFGTFLLYTFLGAFSWNCVLALLGYIAHGQMDLIEKYNHELSLIIIAIFAVACIAWLITKIIRKKRTAK